MGHLIEIRAVEPEAKKIDPRNLRDAFIFTLDAENISFPCQASVLITNDAGIRAINRAHRNIDAATDVLSFPLQLFVPGSAKKPPAYDADMNTGRYALGDIVVSAETVFRQARELQNTVSREATYLTVHSVLHLLGYDHLDEGKDKALMRSREKAIMNLLGYTEAE